MLYCSWPLRVSTGNAKTAKEADKVAKRMNIGIPSGGTYRAGDVVEEMHIPEGGISLQSTSSIDNSLAQALHESMPFALPFELVEWFTPDKATPLSSRRVSYACSSFGVSVPGAVPSKPTRRDPMLQSSPVPS